MAHSHNDHSHVHGASSFGRAFAIGIGLNLAFVVVEFLFGVWANSLSLVADAGHNLSDVLGLALAWGATILAARQPTAKRTYGFRRTTILAALVNAITLLVTVGAVAWEAVKRFSADSGEINGTTVIVVALIGILINGISAYLFASGSKDDLNIRGAFLHLAADAAVSLGVALTGIVIVLTGWQFLDPLVSLLISAVIIWGTWRLLRDSVNLALDAVPENIDIEAVKSYLQTLPNCRDVHDLHIWAMSTTETALTAHVVIPNLELRDDLLIKISSELHDRFAIEHTTLQIEDGSADASCHCRLIKI